MKKYLISTLIFFAAVTTVIVYYSCTKVVVTETCFDKIMNNGETDVDCGGPCKRCGAGGSGGPVIPPCTPTANTMNFNSQNMTLYSGGSSSSGQYVITGNGSNADIRITFNNKPTVDKVYTISTSPYCSSASASECCLEVTQFNQYGAQSGSVYVNIVGGNIVATFCNIPLSSGLTVTGNMTCP